MTQQSAPQNTIESDPVAPTTITLGVWNGEGIGPEIVPPTTRAMQRAMAIAEGVEVQFMPLTLGRQAFEETGQVVPEEMWGRVASLKGWVIGPHDNASYPDGAREQLNPSAYLRKRADLWANIRPVKGVPGAVHEDLDVVVVRENTEGMYADRNMLSGSGDLAVTEDVALAIGVFSTRKIERIVQRAAKMAARRDGVLTVAHKSNVLAKTSAKYVEQAEKIAGQHGITVRPVHIDALCAEVVMRPGIYRTIVAENMFGDILSDLLGALGGSLGIAGSVNAGDGHVMAQATHGAAPDIAGQGIANPAGMMNSGAMLLRELGYAAAGDLLERAVREAIMSRPTADLMKDADQGEAASTKEFSEKVFALLEAMV